MNIRLLAATICIAGVAIAQTPSSTQTSGTKRGNAKTHSSAKHDVGSGAADIGKGAGKGAVSAAKGGG
jgi:hypothetical protein